MDGPGPASIAADPNLALALAGDFWLLIIFLVIALILSGFASAAETAFTSISLIRLKNLAEEGDSKAAEIERLLLRPNTYLSAILVVNSLGVIIATVITTILAVRFWPAAWGVVLSTSLIVLIVLMFCEIAPKIATVQNPLRVAKMLLRPVYLISSILYPVVWLLTAFTSTFLKALGGEVRHRSPFVTAEELRLLVTVGEEEGILEEAETEMIHSIFEFAETTAREVMVPRIDIITLADSSTISQAVDIALEGGFSRIPVYDATQGLDDIEGILYTKDMLKALHQGNDKQTIKGLVRPAYFVPETKKLDDLLREIRLQRVHMAIVVDEYGSVAGLVTIEDLVEEIIGDIQDEYDREEKLYEQINEKEYIFEAKISIHDFNDLMDLQLDADDYETLGGFLYARLDKIPTNGDTIQYEDLEFTVLTTKGRRITKIRVVRHDRRVDNLNNTNEVLMLPSPAQYGSTPEQSKGSMPENAATP